MTYDNSPTEYTLLSSICPLDNEAEERYGKNTTDKTLTDFQLFVIGEALSLAIKYVEEQLEEAMLMSPDMKAAWERTLVNLRQGWRELCQGQGE